MTLTVNNDDGTVSETKVDYITVTAGLPVANLVATPISGTVPLTVTFTDLSTGDPTSWLWEFGDGATATAQHPEHTYTVAGTYTVTLTVSNGFGSDTATGTVTVLNSVTDTAKVVRRIGYRFGGQLIATRVEAEDAQGQLIDNPAFTGLFYVHSDHLGSANAMSYGQDRPALAGTLVPGSVARFLPFGGYRGQQPQTNPAVSSRGFTGHRHNDYIKLVDMRARWYAPEIGRFISPDPIVPDPANPQSFNRYSYVNNQPLNFSDPSGHISCSHESLANEGACQADGTFANGSRRTSAAAPWLEDFAAAGLDSTDPYLVLFALVYFNETEADYLNYDSPETFAGLDVQQTAFILTHEKVQGLIDSRVNGGNAELALSNYIVLNQAAAAVAMLGIEGAFGRPCSFSADTLVMTDDGLMPVAQVEVGEQVLAYNEITGEVEYYPVLATWVHEDPIIVYLTIDGEIIETTPEHPFYTATFGWVEAGDLWPGAAILNASQGKGQVQSIKFVAQPQQMYDLTVAGVHTFFVGKEQWLVHNCDDSIPKYDRGEFGDWEPGVRRDVIARDGGKCAYCGSKEDLTVDHVVSLKQTWEQGAYAWTPQERNAWYNDMNNLVTACRVCNSSKGSKNVFDWLRGR